MRFKKIFFLFLCMAVIIKPSHLDDKQIIPVSILKCGTHLLLKCIQALTKRNFVVWTGEVTKVTKEKFRYIHFYKVPMNVLKMLTNLPKTQFLKTHLFYSDTYAEFLADEKFIKFFMYRDPRDMAVSLAFFMHKQKEEWPLAQKMSFDQLLMDIITDSKTFYNFHPPVIGGIAELYKSYYNWLKVPNMLAIRFEDLIGPQGGGSAEIQKETVKKIALQLGFNLSDEEVDRVSNQIFGGTFSFREGQIGSWRKHFKPEHITAFKERAGQTLIDWGYEKDLNW